MDIRKIKGTVKDYAWGNDDFIPSLVGGYTGEPQAELWFGTHPSGESYTEDGTRLSELIASDASILGERDYERFHGQLPLLFKVLAIASPLSLQCHPDKIQAEDGWRREEEKRKRGEEVNYQDDNQKAEVIAALSPITAMCGFRDIEITKADLAALIPVSYAGILKDISTDIKSLFLGLYSLDGKNRKSILKEFSEALESSSDDSWSGLFLTRKGIALKCLKEYPGDIGAIFPYMMNIVNLQVGEALYLKPDTLHAYVLGNGVELMDASDNVLRGGLTRKRIDLEELERIMSFDPSPASKAQIERTGSGRVSYDTPSESFVLRRASSGSYEVKGGRLSLALVTEGTARFSYKGEGLRLEKGECALIPASAAPYGINIRGTVFFAEIPDPVSL